MPSLKPVSRGGRRQTSARGTAPAPEFPRRDRDICVNRHIVADRIDTPHTMVPAVLHRTLLGKTLPHSEDGASEDVHAPPTDSILSKALRALALTFDLHGGIYVHFGHIAQGICGGKYKPARFVASSASDRRFFLEDSALSRDPVTQRALAAHTPFAWSSVPAGDADDTQRWLCARLKGRAIHGGIAIPVQDYAAGPAFISLYSTFSGEAEALIAARRGPELAYAAASFHEIAKTALSASAGEGDARALTLREMQCLRLAALGQTVNDSAEALRLTPRTVEFHLKNAADKLGASNKLRAVALAVSRRLIEP